jgi:perosamine synthetase
LVEIFKREKMKAILTGISPNAQSDDVRLAARLLIQPQNWLQGKATSELTHKLMAKFKTRAGFGFNSGRAGLWAALKALKLKSGDQILLQAFCCIVVPNAIKAAGGQPVFVDTQKDSINMSISDLKVKITSQTKAIIVQNLFGYPDNMKEIKKVCQQYRLVLIEDTAQSLGARYNDRAIGSWGDMAMFSFGRDKIISSVNGGFLLVNQTSFVSRLEKIYQNLPVSKLSLVWESLMHPLIFSLVKPTYFFCRLGKFSLGKGILFIAQKLGWVKKPVSLAELEGIPPQPAKLASSLAKLVLNQFGKLDKNLAQRKWAAQQYFKQLKGLPIKIIQPDKSAEPTYLRLPILVKYPDKLIQMAYSRKIYLGRWYRSVIGPLGVNLVKAGYQPGSCPNAESLVTSIVNLPTYSGLSSDQIKTVVQVIKDYIELYEN